MQSCNILFAVLAVLASSTVFSETPTSLSFSQVSHATSITKRGASSAPAVHPSTKITSGSSTSSVASPSSSSTSPTTTSTTTDKSTTTTTQLSPQTFSTSSSTTSTSTTASPTTTSSSDTTALTTATPTTTSDASHAPLPTGQPLNPPPLAGYDKSRFCPWCSRTLNLTNATTAPNYFQTCHFFIQQPHPIVPSQPTFVADNSENGWETQNMVFPYAVLNWNLTRPLAMGMLRVDEAVTLELRDEMIVQWSGNRVESFGMGGGVRPPTLAFNEQVFTPGDPSWRTYFDTVSGTDETIAVHHLDFSCAGDLPCELGGPCQWEHDEI